MECSDEYRSKLRTPKKESKPDLAPWGTPTTSFDTDFGNYPLFMNTPSPLKRKQPAAVNPSPHKSGYFLRTPSPLSKGNLSSPLKAQGVKVVGGPPGTPSPHKAGSSTDLFGNRSLLDNLPVPDWDENFLDNFQEAFLFGLGSDDLEGLVKSPAKSPWRSQAFLSNSPLKDSLGLSPQPLLASSPKLKDSSPRGLAKTPATVGGRPLTRQRKLFLQSPERQQPPHPAVAPNPVPILFSSVDSSSSSMFSDEGHETTTSIHSISSYLKQFDEEEVEEELPVMPPAGWTTTTAKKTHDTSKGKGHGKGKTTAARHGKGVSSSSKMHGQTSYQGSGSQAPNMSGGKKARTEPQFTLLKPQTEILNNQICLRMAPRTPPNKIKISRDFSQIQTLPSKEQLRIVRTRFRETLDKAVEQIIEEREKKAGNKATGTAATASSVTPSVAIEEVSLVQNPVSNQSNQVTGLPQLPAAATIQYNINYSQVVNQSDAKRRKR